MSLRFFEKYRVRTSYKNIFIDVYIYGKIIKETAI